MVRFARLLLPAAFLSVASTACFAAASQTPIAFTPDPALRTASPTEIEARVRRACTVTQARIQNVSETRLASPCGCYASRTLRSLDATEVEAYRNTGVFNDTARAKALAAIDACRLQRPF